MTTSVAPFIIAAHVYGLAALDYLGFGLTPPTPSWGELLHQAKEYVTVAWWLTLFPSLERFTAETGVEIDSPAAGVAVVFARFAVAPCGDPRGDDRRR